LKASTATIEAASSYAKGGEAAVGTDGLSIGDETSGLQRAGFIAMPTGILNYEMWCAPLRSGLGTIPCERGEANGGEITLTLTLDQATDTLALGSEEPEILRRCPDRPATR
jgi:hypothetical protein